MTVILLLALAGCGLFSKDSCPAGTHEADGVCVAGDTGAEVDADGDGVPARLDCDDADPSVYPDATETCDGKDNDCDGEIDEDPPTWYADLDRDGYGATTNGTLTQCEQPENYVADGTDCDDANPHRSPAETETCDGVDNDCDGQTDEYGAADAPTWYFDADGDGWGDATTATASCAAPASYVSDGTDCDDTNAAIHPGATETCDDVDQDCDGVTDDDPVDGRTFWTDADADGYGDPSSPVLACSASSGLVTNDDDCEDTSATLHPGASEYCDAIDNDCDGVVDEDGVDGATFYGDADADGYGNASYTLTACSAPAGYVSDATDCDDSRSTVHPGATETCDGLDDDCDGSTDESGATGALTFFADGDGDGYGNPSYPYAACTAPTGYVADDSDCDDMDASVNPSASETCDGVDQDCDGTVDDAPTDGSTYWADADADGYGNPSISTTGCAAITGYVSNDYDCDDLDAASHPGATETCDDADNDCDGSTDEYGATGAPTFYQDADADTYGNASKTVTGYCDAPTGYVANDDDCDDVHVTVHPGASEACDAMDNDCDGTVDEGAGSTWYLDADADGYGSTTSAIACDAPTGYVSVTGDCDDAHATVNPGATEVADGLDNDCDGSVDEGTGSSSYTVCATGGTYTEIQDAVYAASEGEVITVCAGNWDPVYIHGEDVVIEGTDGADVTFIRGVSETPVELVDGNLELSGFTIRGDYDHNWAGFRQRGGSSYLHDVTLNGCIGTPVNLEGGDALLDGISVEDNDLTGGYAIAFSSGNFTVRRSVFANNLDATKVVYAYSGVVDFSNNLVYGNEATSILVNLADGAGGAILSNNVFYGNTSTATTYSPFTMSAGAFHSNIVMGNSGLKELYMRGGVTVEYTDTFDNAPADTAPGTGDITLDPMFVDAAGGDFSLDPSSPCVDRGTTSSLYDDPDGTRNDIGAFGGPGGSW